MDILKRNKETKKEDSSSTNRASVKSDNEKKNKEEAKKKKSSRRKWGLGCLAVSVLFVIVFGGGIGLGAYFYPVVTERIEEFKASDNPVVEDSGEEAETETYSVTSEENAVIDVVEESMPSVVTIAVTEFGYDPNQGVVDQDSNIGTGFIVDPSGIIVTNQHVVSNPNIDYKIITQAGEEYVVGKILRDDVNDIALLELELEDNQKLNELPLGDSDNLVPGQYVLAIGTPLGQYAGSVTTGVVSGLNRSVTTGAGSFFGTRKTYEDVIQTDAAVNPGNSGGPLLNLGGEVIGVNFATTAGADNISFALPINIVKQKLEEYRKFGEFQKAYIGIEYETVYDRNFNPVVLVKNVVDDSPAAKAGLKRKDVIVKVDGEVMQQSFKGIVQGSEPGDELTLTVVRDGEEIELKVELGRAE
jgi:serine protease Do